MTQRERLLAFLNNEPVDRVPIWLLFPYHPAPYYADVWNLPVYWPINELGLKTAVWLDRRGLHVPFFTPEVAISTEEVVEGNEYVTRTVYQYRGLRLTEEKRVSEEGARWKKMLAAEEDLEILLQFPVITDAGAIAAALAPQLERWHQEAAQFPPHLGLMMSDLGEPIGEIYHRSNLEELSVWSLTCPELVDEILERSMVRCRAVYRQVLEAEAGDVFFMVGSELAAPPMVSRPTFQRWIVPYATELIALVHRYDNKVIQHFHGQIQEILPDFLTMAPDALHTIEAPPIGNCTLTEAFETVGDRIGLIGNIQYDEFQRLTPDGMDAAVCAVLEEAQGKRFMLSPTAGPYETEITERQQANYLQFLRSGWLYGKN